MIKELREDKRYIACLEPCKTVLSIVDDYSKKTGWYSCC